MSAEVNGANPNTTYYFEVVATAEEGTGDGAEASFKTIANAPVATTGKAGEVKLTSAVLVGTVNPEGAAATCEFEYGTSAGSLRKPRRAPRSPAPGPRPKPSRRRSTGLAPGTPYYFRLVATGEGGKGEGTEEEFTTPATTRGATGEAVG